MSTVKPVPLDLVAYRLYANGSQADLARILRRRLPDTYGVVFLCGRAPAVVRGAGPYTVLSADSRCVLRRGRWHVLYLGEGKQGFNLPWSLLFNLVRAYRDIRYFMLSDADEQIPWQEAIKIRFTSGTQAVLPQRRKRDFGEYTLERCVIEDIENSFVRVAAFDKTIEDYQAGLYMLHRSVAEGVDFQSVLKHKWMGDLYLVHQVFKRRFKVQTVDVDTALGHGRSTIFDYAGPLNEFMMGIPVLKMKELAGYFGLSLARVKGEMLRKMPCYLPSLIKGLPPGSKRTRAEIKAYMDFIVSQYYRTADVYHIDL